MKRIVILFVIILFLLSGCGASASAAQIAATTLPVYEFTSMLCQGTGLSVTRLVTESVSCLHDYTLQVSQMRAIEAAGLVIMNGAGLEEFLEDALTGAESCVDSSMGIELICPEESHDPEDHHDHDDAHHHAQDSHIWLSPKNAMDMAVNIFEGLCTRYPEYTGVFETNLRELLADLQDLQTYGEAQLADLSCRELITFHDGFSYFAQAFDLTILEAVEEESGSEASAAELIALIQTVQDHQLSAIFTETNGSASAAQIISAETGAKIYTLDMAMAGDSYFEAMYHNIDTIKEALG